MDRRRPPARLRRCRACVKLRVSWRLSYSKRHRFGPASGNDPKLKDSFGRHVITMFVKGANMTFAEASRHIAGVTGNELSVAARRHVTTAKLNEAIADVVDRHAQLDLSRAWGDGLRGVQPGAAR